MQRHRLPQQRLRLVVRPLPVEIRCTEERMRYETSPLRESMNRGLKPLCSILDHDEFKWAILLHDVQEMAR